MDNHLTKLAFCGLRRMGQFECRGGDPFAAWLEAPDWHVLGQVNIFIGANGAGKSTVLELVDLLRVPARLATLARENQSAYGVTGFILVFRQSGYLVGRMLPWHQAGAPFAANTDPENRGLEIQYLELRAGMADGRHYSLARNISKLALDERTQADIAAGLAGLAPPIRFFEPHAPLAPAQVVAELNAAREHLRGVLSHGEMLDTSGFAALDGALDHNRKQPFYTLDDSRIMVMLSDDIRQHNNVHIDALPAGWQRLAKILGWLRDCPEGAICLIEEPETHLHPRLQRHLAGEMGRIAAERSLQLLVTTHSPVLQQSAVWPSRPSVFETRIDGLAPLDSAWRLLDELGIRGADVSQSNGVIWVEGPSDRLYIRHWLDLYCAAHGLPPLRENRDYAFCTYGGANLAHFTVDDENDFIDMVRINRNMVIVIDRDDDFPVDEQGQPSPRPRRSAKHRVIDALDKLRSPTSYLWVTTRYTIESYLPAAMRDEAFVQHGERLQLRPHRKKIDVARRYVDATTAWAGCSDHHAALAAHIAAIERLIRRWDL